MLDINYIKSHIEETKELVTKRGIVLDVDKFVDICNEYSHKSGELDGKRGDQKKATHDIELAKSLKEEIAKLKIEVEKLFDIRTEMFHNFPNFLADDTPEGKNDSENLELKRVGTIQEFDFEPKTHEQIGESLGILDFKRGVKVAGSGFYYWLGEGSILVNAVYRLAQDLLVSKGFEIVIPPVFAKKRTFFGTGYFPFATGENYKIESKDLYAIGTSEQTLVALHDGEHFDKKELPKCYSALTPCFRVEAGSYGRGTRGAFRVHQFQKIEQIVFCTPDESENWHMKCQENIEELMSLLELPYRIVRVCVGDMGAPGYKKYDTEAWFPGFGEYRETHSNTNLTDFQTIRLGIKLKSTSKEKIYPHTISATMATDRVVLAILENFQQKDGTVIIPKALLPYTYQKKVVKIT